MPDLDQRVLTRKVTRAPNRGRLLTWGPGARLRASPRRGVPGAEGWSRPFEVLASGDAYQASVGVGDYRPAQISLRQLVRDPAGGSVGTNSRGSGLHHLLDPERRVAVERAATQPSEQHPTRRDHQREPVTRSLDLLAHLPNAVIQRTAHGVVSSKLPGCWWIGVVAFDRQLVSQPVDLAGVVVVDFSESERFEPARGSWAQVSE